MVKKSLSRGRGPRIREEELEQMIPLYLEGKSYKAIGQEVGRHWQTVRKYVIKALQEREGRELRREALKGALADHFRDLVLALGSLGKLLETPEVGRHMIPGSWQPPTPERRTRLLLQALREAHAKESPLWAWWDDWNRARKSYDETLLALRQRVVKEAAKLGQLSSGVSRAITKELIEVLVQKAASLARNTLLYDSSMIEVRLADNQGKNIYPEELWLGQSTRLATGQDMAKLRGEVSQLMKDMAEWQEVKESTRLYRQMAETKDKIDEEVEVLSLRRAFPGHCRLCPV